MVQILLYWHLAVIKKPEDTVGISHIDFNMRFSQTGNGHSLPLPNFQLNGASFTWSNNQNPPSMSRLDRFLISGSRVIMYPMYVSWPFLSWPRILPGPPRLQQWKADSSPFQSWTDVARKRKIYLLWFKHGGRKLRWKRGLASNWQWNWKTLKLELKIGLDKNSGSFTKPN